jgi:VIT family
MSIRASVLGANDGLFSTASIVIGVAAAQPNRQTIVLAALAGMIADAMSMATENTFRSIHRRIQKRPICFVKRKKSKKHRK